MRPVLCGLAAGVIACHAATAAAQQGSIQISTAAQGVTGDVLRITGEHQFEPDFGVAWLQPGTRFGTFQIELRGARRADRLHLGRNYAALRELKYAGLEWTLEAGDTYFTRAVGEYGFSNLTTPAVTFSGGALSGRGPRGAVHVIGGRATAWRNIFGTDPDTLAQTIGMLRGSYRLNERVDLLGRASRVKTSGLREFTFTIADSRQAGGGVRLTIVPAVQIVADGSLVQYRRLDSNQQKRDGSFLAGANVHLPRGWIQVNASRFSPGEFPAMNDSMHDREGVFGAGEYDLWSRLRVFAGWEAVRTNIDPDPSLSASRNVPRNLAARGFGGFRVQFGPRSTITLRAEEGDRIARPVLAGVDRESDTGLRAAEWQAGFGPVTTYTRVSRRQNVDRASADASYRQDEVSAQLFMRVSRDTQLFGLGTYTRHETGGNAGSSYWQAGGGAQMQILRRSLWVRGEGLASRNVDLITRDYMPRESINVGLNGVLARGTSFSFNIAADRTPILSGGGTPWTTRSTVRLVQSFSTGSARVPTLDGRFGEAAARPRGTGTVLGSVFTDWNANGTHDPGEEPLENIPVKITAVSTLTTRRDGEFAFHNVPAGPQQVGLDTSAVPVDFDPPAEPSVTIELDRNITRRVSFGLIPLGSIRGRIVRDTNGNGRVDPGEEPIDGAVLVLDGGLRSEQARKGSYRFDSIRTGDHVVTILRDSLPEGAVVTGASEVPLALTRNQMSVQIDFAVSVEKRPETRKVFPPRVGSSQRPAAKPIGADATAARPATVRDPAARPPASATAVRSATPPRGGRPVRVPASALPEGSGLQFAVQIAALLDPLRARTMVRELAAAGYSAYLLPPGPDDPDGPYKIRVGGYPSRAAAGAAAARLERERQEKLWVIRDTR